MLPDDRGLDGGREDGVDLLGLDEAVVLERVVVVVGGETRGERPLKVLFVHFY